MYRDQDTNYIRNYAEHLSIRLVSVNKYNLVRLDDYDKGSSLMFRPEYDVNIGLGFSYKWASLDLVFNLGLEDSKVTSSETMDIQVRMYNSKLLVEGKLQYYNGYTIFRNNGPLLQLYSK